MLLIPLALLAFAAPAPKPVASIEGVSEYRLPNGMKVLLVPDASKPTTTVNLTVFVGSRHENYGEKGMAHLFEHMLFKRTKKFASIKDELSKLGGWANGTTWYDRTNYFESFPADDKKLDTALELEAERLRNAIVSRTELQTEMTVVRNELEMGENDPQSVLSDRVMSSAFRWHNYGDSTIGPKSDIENVPNEKLLAWYETYYQPDNAMLVIAGKFDEAKALQKVTALFGKMPKPKRELPKTYTEEPTQDGEVAVNVRRTGGAPVLTVGYHAPAASHPDAAVIDVLAQMIGGSPSGRLYKDLVVTKKAASVECPAFAVKQPLKEHGYIMCNVKLQPSDNVAAAKATLLTTLESFAKTAPTQEEVDRAKASLLKEISLLLSNSDAVGVFLSEFAAAGDWRLLFLGRDRLAAVTPADVSRVAAQYFKATNRTLGEYIPTTTPERSEIPLAVDLTSVLKDYKGQAAVAQGEAFDASPKNIDSRTQRSALPGGLKVAVLAKKTRAESVSVVLQMNYGDEKTLANQSAIASLAEKMMMRGSKNKTRAQVAEQLDLLKAEVNVHANAQSLAVVINAHRPELAKVLALVAENLREPAFDAAEFEALKREVLTEAEEKKDDPMSIGMRSLKGMLVPVSKGHPLYQPSWQEVIGDTKAVTLDQVKAFYARFYGLQAGQLAVVGDVDGKAFVEQVAQLFGNWKAKEAYTRISVPAMKPEAKISVIETPDKAMAFYGTGATFKLKDSDADYPAIMLADYMLGGGFMAGRVPQRLREKEGLSYGAGTFARVSSFDDPAVLGGYAIYAPQNVGKIETGFAEEISKAVKAGFTETELKLAKEGLLKEREQMRAQDPMLANELVNGLELDRMMVFEAAIDEKLKTLSAADVNAALKRHIDPTHFSVLKVGDFKKK